MRQPNHKNRPGSPANGETNYAVHDPNRRQRRLGVAVLVLLVLTPLVAAQAAFGFPLSEGLLPGLGKDGSKADRPAPSPVERHEEDRRPRHDDAHPPLTSPPEDPALYLTVPRLGLERDTVRNDDSELALGRGAIKLPQTGFPWEEGANTYIACHRLGYPLTESHNQCRELPSMRKGDEVVLEDSEGAVYRYRVTETLTVLPHETAVANPVPGRQVVSLQTCIEAPGDLTTLGPDWGARFVVRADLMGHRAPGEDR